MAEQRLHGAELKGSTTVPKKQLTPAVFGAVWDSDGYFRPSESKHVLTIPRPKRRGRYQVRVAVRWMNPWIREMNPLPTYDEFAQMIYYTCFTINDGLLGNEARATASPVLSATGTTQYFAADANLGFGDSVGVKLNHSVGDTVDAFVFFEIRRLGPRVAGISTFATGPMNSAADIG